MHEVYTVKIDIFECVYFREFMKMGNFAYIRIYILSIIGFFAYCYFQVVHIFTGI